MSVIEANQVEKSFGKTKALAGVNLKVDQGQILGLLGPNGAGKTTLIRILATLLHPDGGSVSVNGVNVVEDPMAVRKMIGLAGQFAAVDEALTGRENLEIVGRLYRLPKREARERAAETLERLSLSDAADRTVRTYSGGMRRRLDLGASLVGQPTVLLLDEPTTGLDPKTRNELWAFLRRLVDDGTTVLLTTQYLEEADHLADSVVVIDKGSVVAEGTPEGLKHQLGSDIIEIGLRKREQGEKVAEILTTLSKSKPSFDADSEIVALSVENGSRVLLDAVRLLDSSGIEIKDVSLRRPSLDDVFLSLTGRKATEVEG